jgi:phage-related tail fiber protein
MWRPNSEEAAQLSISIGDGPATTVAWPAGKSTLPWPAAIKIADGAEYQLALAGGAASERVRFAVMPAVPEDVSDAAQALIARGCQNQLDVLVDGIEGE